MSNTPIPTKSNPLPTPTSLNLLKLQATPPLSQPPSSTSSPSKPPIFTTLEANISHLAALINKTTTTSSLESDQYSTIPSLLKDIKSGLHAYRDLARKIVRKKDLRIKELVDEKERLTLKLSEFAEEVESLAGRSDKVVREIDEQEINAKKKKKGLAGMNLELKTSRLWMCLLVVCILGLVGAWVVVQVLGQMLAPCSRVGFQ